MKVNATTAERNDDSLAVFAGANTNIQYRLEIVQKLDMQQSLSVLPKVNISHECGTNGGSLSSGRTRQCSVGESFTKDKLAQT